MGKAKHGFLTPKAISNRIKAKGLGKLRWYCQMCEKQCRDENGFKCHMTSESHQRQLLLFAEKPKEFIDDFSKDFLDGYLDVLRRKAGKRVLANKIYMEYIGFKQHIHMNATKWVTLTEFVKWLGKEGYCLVDETERGWWVQYIDRDASAIKKQEAVRAKEKLDLDDEERQQRFIARQIERNSECGASYLPKPTELLRDSEATRSVTVGFQRTEADRKSVLPQITTVDNPLASLDDKKIRKQPRKEQPAKRSALDEIREYEEQLRAKKRREEVKTAEEEETKLAASALNMRGWLAPAIVVKVVAESLTQFHGKKAFVHTVENKHTAVIQMLSGNERLRVDETHVETVVPNLGRDVKILFGPFRGETAELLEVDADNFCCTVRVLSGDDCGKRLKRMPYEHISKLHIKKEEPR